MNLKELQQSPEAFRSHLLIDCDGSPRRLSECLDDFQAEDFAAIDPALANVTRPTESFTGQQRFWLERPRGSSKTTDIATSVAWLLFASRRKLKGVAASGDRDQAKLLRDSLDTLLRLNPWLSKILTVQNFKVLNSHTGSEVEILSSDSATSYGILPDFIVLDELTHWGKRDLFDSLFSSAAKRKHCLILAITNAGFDPSWQWDLRESIRLDESWRFHRLDRPASWISEEHLREQQRLLPPKVYSRLWENRWSDGSGDALPVELIDASVQLKRAPSQPEPGWCYAAGLDIGLRHDASALVVVGKHVGHSEEIRHPQRKPPAHARTMIDLGLMDSPESEVEYKNFPATGRLKLVAVRTWLPAKGETIQFTDIEKGILELHKRFPLSRLSADVWQAENLLQRLRQHYGIAAEGVNFTGPSLQSMATEVLNHFREHAIDLFPHVQLIADLKAMRIAEKSYGFRLVPGSTPQDGTPHGDSATALALAMMAAKGISSGMPLRTNQQLVLFAG